MNYLWPTLIVLTCVALLFLLALYIVFFIVFYVPDNKKISKEEFPIPHGKIYEPFRDQMVSWIKEVRSLPQESVSITSFDGLKLNGKYYEYAPGAPIELMMHGYRGEAERDLCGGVQRCFALGHSALIVDQRACGTSDGNIITFGVKEKQDCLDWLNFMIQKFGPEVRIILTGISMGGATVLMASGETLPPNVIGILADCGYTSPKEIIIKVVKQLHLPVCILYPMIKLSAKVFGQFDLESCSATEAVQKSKVPIILFHGEADDFVPCDMSRVNYEACASAKKLVTIPDAGHGLSYVYDSDKYLAELGAFFPLN